MPPAVRFGLVLPIRAAGTPIGSLWDEVVAEAVAAEAAGFDAVFLPDFHQARGGSLTSPLLLGAALLQATSTLRFGTSVLAAPLYHPARLAEDAAMLHQTSGGRFILGVGPGHVPGHFDLFGVPHRGRGEALEQALAALRRALAGENVALDGPAHRGAGPVLAGAPPLDGPPVWIGAHGPRGVARAGRLGDAWLSDPQRDVGTIGQLAEGYRAAAAAAGRVPAVALFRDGWIDDSERACRERWGPHALAVHRLYYNLGTYHRELEPWVDEVWDRADFTFDRLAPGRFLVGDGPTVRATVADWHERTGAGYIAVRLRQPGGPGHRETLQAIARFGAEVVSGS